jgi:hypothetical protein
VVADQVRESGHFAWRLSGMQIIESRELEEYFVKDLLHLSTHRSYCCEISPTINQVSTVYDAEKKLPATESRKL